MTPDKVEAALASRGIDAALVDEGLSYFHGSGDNGDKLYVFEIRKALSALTEALAESRRDAARYRWLRDKSNDAKPGTPTVYSCCWAHRDELDGHLLDGESLDAEIDTAMKDTDHAR